MKVNKVTFTGVRINANDSKEVKYSYNKVLDVVRNEHIPATFRPYEIELPNNKKLEKILEELKIKFIKDRK